LNVYLGHHPEIDLDKWDDLGYMDNYTNPRSTILGLLCETAYKKNGMKGLKEIMTYHSLDEIFEKEFHIAKGKRNLFLRQLINNP